MQIGKSTRPDRAPDPALVGPAATGPGAGFDRLVAAAQGEADRRQAAAARTGASADAFTDQAWLEAVKHHGGEIGLGSLANAITSDGHGQMSVADAAIRQRIMAYRADPTVRAVMAVKRAGDSRAALTSELGRAPNDGEMRVAELVGAKSAAKLILTRQGTPLSSAALAAPDAAATNHALFYRPDGSPLTVNEVLQNMMKADPAAPGTATAPTVLTPGATTPGQPVPPDVMRALQSQANFASSAARDPAKPQQRAAPPPPDLALVHGTIGNLSMPGAATKGGVSTTGGQLTGWRGQMASEVTNQVTHPERVVQNLPSNVTVPAPQQPRYMPANEVHRAPVATTTIAPASSPSNLLGPQLAQSPASVGTTGVSAKPALLPNLIVDGQAAPPAALPGDALALLPVGQQPQGVLNPSVAALPPAASSLAPLGPAPTPSSAPSQLPGSVSIAQPEAALERPSRYGPQANGARDRTSRVLNYASPTDGQTEAASASAAGIRPSRYFGSAASAAQQYAAMSRMAAPPASAPAPVTAAPVGPDGNPLLPPVPGPNGLPPLTAAEALQSGPAQVMPSQAGPVPPRPIGQADAERVAILEGTKPLDLAPDAPALAVAAAPAAATYQPSNRSRPRTTPPFMYGR